MFKGTWVRSFTSARAANDMRSVLVRHGFGPKNRFAILPGADGLSDLMLTSPVSGAAEAQAFLRGWIACTNTKRERPKVR